GAAHYAPTRPVPGSMPLPRNGLHHSSASILAPCASSAFALLVPPRRSPASILASVAPHRPLPSSCLHLGLRRPSGVPQASLRRPSGLSSHWLASASRTGLRRSSHRSPALIRAGLHASRRLTGHRAPCARAGPPP